MADDLDRVKHVFRQFDLNGDGVIDQAELTQALQTLDPACWTDVSVGTLLSTIDKAGSGRIQYDDFVDWLGGSQGSGACDTTLAENFRSAYRRMSISSEESDDGRAGEASQSLGDLDTAGTGDKSKKKPPKRGKGGDGAGVKCDKTLEFGKPIRNAICIGSEVWTVDWHGVATVRDRDDAAKVLGEIPTDRFVWSMLHMKPGLMWMGQEAQGISLFDSKRKEPKGNLSGGHTGGVTCLTCDDSLGDIDAEEFPLRKAWSGSNDFTLREWIIHTWRSKKAVPAAVKEDKEAVVVEMGRWKVGMLKGKHMHGHKNGLKTLLKLGPILWSGSDDASIRLWRCIDGECIEVVEDAHAGSVNKLAVVKCFVWSAGADGLIKEWNMTGDQRVCLRQVAPPGSEKGIYALLPLGHDVWVCGHHPSIQVYSQRDMAQTSTEDGHKPYVSNLIGVDRVESKIIWSTSFGDRKLKVWWHTVRGEEASVDELWSAGRSVGWLVGAVGLSLSFSLWLWCLVAVVVVDAVGVAEDECVNQEHCGQEWRVLQDGKWEAHSNFPHNPKLAMKPVLQNCSRIRKPLQLSSHGRQPWQRS
ncbi:putative calcium-binding protein CML29 [Symbiodinium microadriaticum]|uniref:Putative calcium-binding protein CML29 n=1 Tax=Symbiodinium microadriaticum TaxID=2951 RepID=A0A1Q9EDA0_SYMMI|nr:putative calcium-binding protein CML29 [Symbiodinium microadriaticum]